MRYLKRFVMLMIVAGLLLSIPAALAQEEAVAETGPAVPGITAGVLLLGLGGIILVGGIIIARDNFTTEDESE